MTEPEAYFLRVGWCVSPNVEGFPCSDGCRFIRQVIMWDVAAYSCEDTDLLFPIIE